MLYTGQALADGAYTVTATAVDVAGNVSPVSSAPRQLVIDTSAPIGAFAISGLKTAGGQAATTNPRLTLQLLFLDPNLTTTEISLDGGVTWLPPSAYAAPRP